MVKDNLCTCSVLHPEAGASEVFPVGELHSNSVEVATAALVTVTG
jgi:hypothetical protein